MQTASLTEAKNQFSALIDRVRAGGSVLILDRGVPVARLESIIATDGADGGRLERLERTGAVRPARGEAPVALMAEDPPRPLDGASVVEAVLDERRSGR